MPGIGGLSIANNLLSNAVQLNLNNNQKALQASTTRLSSGLRINTAADDPSGLAISETLQSQVNGFDQAAQNVQDASNAVTVADGALQTTTDILQRIRSLAVEAASDITSSADKQDLQAEINQLLLEVNRVAQNTQFNGITLLDGSHAGFQPQQSAFITIESNAALASAGVNPLGTSTSSTTTSSQLVTNGNFDTPAVATNTISNGTVPTGWSETGGNNYLYNGTGGGGPAPLGSGVQGVGIGLNASGSLTQTLTGLNPDATYTVSFQAADDSVGGGTLTVSANGTTVTPSNIGSLTYPGFQTFTTQQFTASSSGTVTLTFDKPDTNGAVNLTDVVLNETLTTTTTASQLPADSGLLIASAVAANANFGTTVGTASNGLQGIQGFTAASLTAGYTVDGTIEIQVINTGASIAAQETFFASGATTAPVSVAGQLLSADSVSALFDNVQITTGNFTTADVGASAYIKVSQNVAALSNPTNAALTFQSGAIEGATIQVGIAATNTQALRISNINVLMSAATDPSIGAEDAIGQIDLALQSLLTERANVGAIVVRLGEDEDNDDTASVNLQASESNIRDLDVASETTNFNKLQILVQVGTSVLAQANTNAQSVLKLFP